MRTRIWLLTVALSIGAPAAAFAQVVDAHAAADEEFRQGREAMKQGDYRRALKFLRTSHALEPGRGKLVNIAVCEEKVGLLASAERHYQEVLPQLTSGDERWTAAKEGLERVGPKVPHLRLEIAAGAPSGTTVTLDGEPVAVPAEGMTLALDPGKHTVTGKAPGGVEKPYEVTLREGERSVVSVAPGTAAVAAAPLAVEPVIAAVEAKKPSRTIRWKAGVGGLAVGGLAVIAGVGTGVAALGKRSLLASGCAKTTLTCPPKLQADVDAYNALGDASTALIIGGGVLAAAGMILVVTAPSPQPGARAWIAPEIGAGVLGVRGGF
jgi:hypothetical protein